MPRYFFDFNEDGKYLRDETGVSLADDEAARAEARRTLGEMTSETLTYGERPNVVDLVVRATDGTIVFTMTLQFSEGEG